MTSQLIPAMQALKENIESVTGREIRFLPTVPGSARLASVVVERAIIEMPGHGFRDAFFQGNTVAEAFFNLAAHLSPAFKSAGARLVFAKDRKKILSSREIRALPPEQKDSFEVDMFSGMCRRA